MGIVFGTHEDNVKGWIKDGVAQHQSKRSASPTIDRAELIFLRRLGGNSRVEAHQYD